MNINGRDHWDVIRTRPPFKYLVDTPAEDMETFIQVVGTLGLLETLAEVVYMFAYRPSFVGFESMFFTFSGIFEMVGELLLLLGLTCVVMREERFPAAKALSRVVSVDALHNMFTPRTIDSSTSELMHLTFSAVAVGFSLLPILFWMTFIPVWGAEGGSWVGLEISIASVAALVICAIFFFSKFREIRDEPESQGLMAIFSYASDTSDMVEIAFLAVLAIVMFYALQKVFVLVMLFAGARRLCAGLLGKVLFVLLVVEVASAVTYLTLAIRMYQKGEQSSGGLRDELSSLMSSTLGGVRDQFGAKMEQFGSMASSARDKVDEVRSDIENQVDAAASAVTDRVEDASSQVMEMKEEVADKVEDVTSAAADFKKDLSEAATGKVRDSVKDVASAVADLREDMSEAATGKATDSVKGVTSAVDDAKKDAKKAAKDAEKAAKDAKKAARAAKKAAKAAVAESTEGVTSAVEDAQEEVTETVGEAVETVADAAESLGDAASALAGGLSSLASGSGGNKTSLGSLF